MKHHSYNVDVGRAREVFDGLIGRLREKGHPFDHSAPPQVRENMPENLKFGGVQHACFLWAACYYMRGGIDSEVAFRQLTLIHERKPYLFEPKWFWEQMPKRLRRGNLAYDKKLATLLTKEVAYKELRTELSAHGLGFSLEDNTRFWVLNAVKMHKHWEGDPRKLFLEVTSFDTLVTRIANLKKFSLAEANGFLGFQHKMVSMIAYFLAETKLVNPHTIPVPVDFHVLRMLISTEIITPGRETDLEKSIFSKELLAVAREVTLQYSRDHGIEMIELCDALWLFSRAMCSWHPDTESKTPEKSERRKHQQKQRDDPHRKADSELPVEQEKGPGRKSKIFHIPPTWDEAQRAAFNRSCRVCPVEHLCRFAVPSANYYLQGGLVRRIRSSPPVGDQLLLLEVSPEQVSFPRPPWDKEESRRAAMKFLNGGEPITGTPEINQAHQPEFF